MTIELRSAIAWPAVFLAYELCAHWRTSRPVIAVAGIAVLCLIIYLWPIYTLSGTIWGGEHWWHPLTDAVILFTLVLLVHLVRHVSATYLIIVAASIAIATAAHAILGGRFLR